MKGKEPIKSIASMLPAADLFPPRLTLYTSSMRFPCVEAAYLLMMLDLLPNNQ